MLEVRFSKSAFDFLKKCDKEIYGRVIEKLKVLSENPFPRDSKRIIGRKEKVFRARVGKYRILYFVDDANKILFVSEIDLRKRVYHR